MKIAVDIARKVPKQAIYALSIVVMASWLPGLVALITALGIIVSNDGGSMSPVQIVVFAPASIIALLSVAIMVDMRLYIFFTIIGSMCIFISLIHVMEYRKDYELLVLAVVATGGITSFLFYPGPAWFQ